VKNGDPSIIHDIALNGASEAKYWFQTTDSSGKLLFSAPAAGTFNNVAGSRNALHNPGFQNWNLSLYKKFAITEAMGFQFRAEAYDFINHPNWNSPDYRATSSQFGMVTAKTNLVRTLQLSLRFDF